MLVALHVCDWEDNMRGSQKNRRPCRQREFVFVIAFAALCPGALAADKYYVGAGGLWHIGPWSLTPGGPANTTAPMAGDNAYVVSPTSFTVTRQEFAGVIGLGTVQFDGTGGSV